MSLIQNHMFHQNWFHKFIFMILFPWWPIQYCSEQQSCTAFHVLLFHLLVLKLGPQKVQSVLFLEHLQEFNLDLCSPRYGNFPQVSCLGMNSGGGWNPNCDGSYLPEYSEYEDEFWIHCKSGFYIRSVNVLAHYPSPILRYSECTKTYQF